MSYAHTRFSLSNTDVSTLEKKRIGASEFIDKLVDILVTRCGYELILKRTVSNSSSFLNSILYDASASSADIPAGTSFCCASGKRPIDYMSYFYAITNITSINASSGYRGESYVGGPLSTDGSVISHSSSHFPCNNGDKVYANTFFRGKVGSAQFSASPSSIWCVLPSIVAVVKSVSGESGSSFPVYYFISVYTYSSTKVGVVITSSISYGCPLHPEYYGYSTYCGKNNSFVYPYCYALFTSEAIPNGNLFEFRGSLDYFFVQDIAAVATNTRRFLFAGRPSYSAFKFYTKTTAVALANSYSITVEDASLFAVNSYVMLESSFNDSGAMPYSGRLKIASIDYVSNTLNFVSSLPFPVDIPIGTYVSLAPLPYFSRGGFSSSQSDNNTGFSGFFAHSTSSNANTWTYHNPHFRFEPHVYDEQFYFFPLVMYSYNTSASYTSTVRSLCPAVVKTISYFGMTPYIFDSSIVCPTFTSSLNDYSIVKPTVSGTIGSYSSKVLTDSNLNLSINSLAGKSLVITAGIGSIQSRKIISNTSNTITIANEFDTLPVAGSSYSICEKCYSVGKYFYNDLFFEEAY